MKYVVFILISTGLIIHSMTAQSFQEIKKTLPSDGAAADFYGTSVSISGDWAVVGSVDNSPGGSAYIYWKDQGGIDNWGEVKKLKANDAANGDRFGFSVSISGNYLVLGSRNDDDNGSSSGSAYIFSKNQGGANNWGFVKKITASDASNANYFGNTVSISNDNIIVGSFGNQASTGSAYLFAKNEGGLNNWGEVKRLIASDGAAGDRFGLSVSVNGNYAVVGAQLDDDNATDSGSAYIFFKDEGGFNNWGEVTKLLPSDGGSTDDWFGWSVGIHGTNAIVSKLQDDELGTNRGSAYIYSKDEGGLNNWGELAKVQAPDAINFGRAVDIEIDVVLVGSILNGPGSAYIFSKDSGGINNWGQTDKLVPSDGSSGDRFGLGVSISGDKIIVSSILDVDQGLNSGAGYIFDKVLCSTDLVITDNPIPSNIYQAGQSISSASLVPASGIVQFAANTIYLDGGFEVVMTGEFEALINPCSN